MHVFKVFPGSATVSLTAEDCALLSRVCLLVEMAYDPQQSAMVNLLCALFRALAELTLAYTCLGPKGREDLDEMLEELGMVMAKK